MAAPPAAPLPACAGGMPCFRSPDGGDASSDFLYVARRAIDNAHHACLEWALVTGAAAAAAHVDELLIHAISSGTIDCVDALFRHGANANAAVRVPSSSSDSAVVTPLAIACLCVNPRASGIDLATFLLARGAVVNNEYHKLCKDALDKALNDLRTGGDGPTYVALQRRVADLTAFVNVSAACESLERTELGLKEAISLAVLDVVTAPGFPIPDERDGGYDYARHVITRSLMNPAGMDLPSDDIARTIAGLLRDRFAASETLSERIRDLARHVKCLYLLREPLSTDATGPSVRCLVCARNELIVDYSHSLDRVHPENPRVFAGVFGTFSRRLVAVKVARIPATREDKDEAYRECMREIKLLSGIFASGGAHPNIVNYLHSERVRDAGALLVVMERCAFDLADTGALAALLGAWQAHDGGAFPADSVAWFLRGLADGMSFLHSARVLNIGHPDAAAGVVHGNICPPNVYVSMSLQGKIGDLGIGGELSGREAAEHADDDGVHVVRPFRVVSARTKPYIPEGEPPGKPADVYSLAHVFYHAVSGGRFLDVRNLLACSAFASPDAHPHPPSEPGSHVNTAPTPTLDVPHSLQGFPASQRPPSPSNGVRMTRSPSSIDLEGELHAMDLARVRSSVASMPITTNRTFLGQPLSAELEDLLCCMVAPSTPTPTVRAGNVQRYTADDCLAHPFFWDRAQRIEFLAELNEFVIQGEKSGRAATSLTFESFLASLEADFAVEYFRAHPTSRCWLDLMSVPPSKGHWSREAKFQTYRPSAKDAIRFCRNMIIHHSDAQGHGSKNEVIEYFLERHIPFAIMVGYRAVRAHFRTKPAFFRFFWVSAPQRTERDCLLEKLAVADERIRSLEAQLHRAEAMGYVPDFTIPIDDRSDAASDAGSGMSYRSDASGTPVSGTGGDATPVSYGRGHQEPLHASTLGLPSPADKFEAWVTQPPATLVEPGPQSTKYRPPYDRGQHQQQSDHPDRSDRGDREGKATRGRGWNERDDRRGRGGRSDRDMSPAGGSPQFYVTGLEDARLEPSEQQQQQQQQQQPYRPHKPGRRWGKWDDGDGREPRRYRGEGMYESDQGRLLAPDSPSMDVVRRRPYRGGYQGRGRRRGGDYHRDRDIMYY